MLLGLPGGTGSYLLSHSQVITALDKSLVSQPYIIVFGIINASLTEPFKRLVEHVKGEKKLR